MIRNGELEGNGSIYKDDPAYATTAPMFNDINPMIADLEFFFNTKLDYLLGYTPDMLRVGWILVLVQRPHQLPTMTPITSPITQPSPAGDDTTEPFPPVRPFLDDLPNPISDPATNPNNIILQPVKELRRSSVPGHLSKG